MKLRTTMLPVLMLVALASFAQAQAQYDDDRFQITDCRGRSASLCLKGECTCDEWQIKLFKKDGREWGLITGKTLESVQRQLKKNQDFDVSYARFFGTEVDDGGMNYQHPGKPICRASCASSSSRRLDDDERRNEIAEAADELQDKMLQEIRRVTKALAKIERKVGNPYRSVGFVMKDYVNVLKDVFRKQKELRGKLAETSASMYSTMSDINYLYTQMQSVDGRAQQAYNALPANVRGVIENGALESTGSAWNNQRIRDFNNSITIQTLNLRQDQITVVQRSESDPNNRITYQLQPGDILTQTIAVQSTDAPDRWMVTFQTNGRRISKRTERDTGALTDNVSKMTLFFSNEQSAREAAEALKSNK